jgi:ADP-ribose pyrophosphatase
MSGDRPRRALGDADVELIADEVAFEGFNRLHRVRLRHRRHDGGWSREIEREVFERDNAAALLPYDPARDRVVLVEQFRPGPYMAGLACWQLEPVAGMIRPDEDPVAVARREAREEAGCDVLAVEPICTYTVSPGYATETVFVYCGRVDASGLGGVHGCGEEDEDTRAHVLGFEEAMARLASGEFQFALTVICLQWLALNRERLRALWRAR